MTVAQFQEFYECLQEMFNMENLTVKGLKVWSTAFANVDFRVANQMFQIYVLTDSRKPKPWDLLKHKEQAIRELHKMGQQVEKQMEECKYCNNTGIVLVENELGDEVGYKCTCKNNINVGVDPKYIDIVMLKSMIQDYNGVWRKRIKERPEITNEFIDKVKKIIARRNAENSRGKRTEITSTQMLLG
jgi:hypothetical protein